MSSRRQLRMVYTSSDDDDDEQPPPPPPQHLDDNNNDDINNDDNIFEDAIFHDHPEQLQESDIEMLPENSIPNISTVTLNSTSTATTTAAIDISDDDFADVGDSMSDPSPPEPESIPVNSVLEASTVSASVFVASDCPVNDQLRRLGLNLRREWLDSCQLGLENSISGFGGSDVDTKAKLCFGQFLNSDMNFVGGGGGLPENVCGLHNVDLAGPFVLQVDEIVNIGCSLKERYNNAAPGLKRCLKLSMTDGVQRVFGMEYRPIKSVAALSPAGFKVVIRNVHVRRGILMLVPEVLEILGGSVDELEAARQRVVQEVNKPPRGKRTRTGDIPPLSNRATLAAWPQNGVTDQSVRHNVTNPPAINIPNSVNNGSAPLPRDFQAAGADRRRQAISAVRETTEQSETREINQHSSTRESTLESIRSMRDQYSINRETGQQPINPVTARDPTLLERHSHSNVSEVHEPRVIREANELPRSGESGVLNSSSTTVIEDEDVPIVDSMKHSVILSGDKEFPFTYMGSLLTKWQEVYRKEPYLRGKIKGFVSAVQKFVYRGQSTFGLSVYIDDGSLIIDVLIHHNVVRNRIGYSPEDVTAAITSSNSEISEPMKNIMLQFQSFLLSFEGTMVVEMNNASKVPVVLEMAQSCLDIDAWQLLNRVKPPTSDPLPQVESPNVVRLSP